MVRRRRGWVYLLPHFRQRTAANDALVVRATQFVAWVLREAS